MRATEVLVVNNDVGLECAVMLIEFPNVKVMDVDHPFDRLQLRKSNTVGEAQQHRRLDRRMNCSRSLATSFTVLMPVGSLLLFGGETLKDFAFALLVGVASGAYSSIFIATPVLVEWKEREKVYMRRRKLVMQDHGGLVPAFASVTIGDGAAAAPAGGGRRSNCTPGREARSGAHAARRTGAGAQARPQRPSVTATRRAARPEVRARRDRRDRDGDGEPEWIARFPLQVQALNARRKKHGRR